MGDCLPLCHTACQQYADQSEVRYQWLSCTDQLLLSNTCGSLVLTTTCFLYRCLRGRPRCCFACRSSYPTVQKQAGAFESFEQPLAISCSHVTRSFTPSLPPSSGHSCTSITHTNCHGGSYPTYYPIKWTAACTQAQQQYLVSSGSSSWRAASSGSWISS